VLHRVLCLLFGLVASLTAVYNKNVMGLLGAFKKKQRILFAEAFPGTIRAAIAEAAIPDGAVKIVDATVRHFNFPLQQSDLLMDELLRAFGYFKTKKRLSVALALHNDAAVTTRLKAAVSRMNTGNTLQEPELEDLLFKAQWRIFDKGRSAISAKMGIHDLDLHLADAKVEEVRLDGHRVINPTGFRPRLVEFDITNTFISKRFIHLFRQRLGPARPVELVIERNAALVNAMLRFLKRESAVVASVSHSQAAIAVVDRENLIYQQHFTWGNSSLIHAMGHLFTVRLSTARKILERYADGRVSMNVRRKIEKSLAAELSLFFQGVEIALESLKPKHQLPQTICINQEQAMPPLVASRMKAHKWPKTIFKTAPEVIVLRPDFLSVQLKLNHPLPNSLTALLSEFLYGNRGEKYLNSLLNKRIRWLEV